MEFGLRGRKAIVTGGSRGIGKAIALELAREGVDVAIVARGQEELSATAEELAAETGQRIVPIVTDVTSWQPKPDSGDQPRAGRPHDGTSR